MNPILRNAGIGSVVLVLLAIGYCTGSDRELANPFPRRVHVDAAPKQGPAGLILAHVADPRLGAPPGSGGRTNERTFADALAGLRAGPGTPAPSALVVTGDILPASPAATDSTPSPADTAGQGANPAGARNDAGGGGAGQGPLQQGEGAATAPLTSEQAADSLGALLAGSPAAYVYLVPESPLPAALMERVRRRAQPAGVRVHDLTACYALAAAETESCRADVPGTRYRLVGLRSLAGLQQDDAVAAMNRLRRMEEEGREYSRLMLLAAARLPTAGDTTALLWEPLTASTTTVAALSGTASGAGSRGTHLVRTDPLGNPRTSAAPGAPAVSLVMLRGERAGHEVLTLPLQRTPGTVPAPPQRGPFARWWGLGDRLGEPARTAVFMIGVLVAFLTVAALWKVPELTAATSPAPSTPVAGLAPTASVNGPAQGVVQETGIFATNLGRTVLSGLTGVAVVTLLREIWGISAAAGQGFFVIIFVVFLFLFLLLTAVARAAIDAKTSTLAGGPQSLVFWDSFVNVLLGHGRTRAQFWEERFDSSQQGALAAIRGLRDEINAEVRRALENCGVHTRAEDFRVNVSLLAETGDEVFYIATDPNSNPRSFDRTTMAYVTAVSGEARWWRRPYMEGHTVLASDATLSAPRVSLNAPLVGMWFGGKAVTAGTARLKLTRGEGVKPSAELAITAETSVCAFLQTANESETLSGFAPPVVMWMDADGRLLIAVEADDPQLRACIAFPGCDEVAFRHVDVPGVELFADHAEPRLFPEVSSPLMLANYFQSRRRDYDAFVLLPIPMLRNGPHPGRRRGVLHISFKHLYFLDALWTELDRVERNAEGAAKPFRLVPSYDHHALLLQRPVIASDALQASFRQGTRVLGHAIQNLSDTWFRTYGKTID